MHTRSFIGALRRGRASWSVLVLYALLLPVVLGLLPKPQATAEYLLLRDLATAEICAMSGAAQVPGQSVQHQPDCILCATACPFAGPVAATTPSPHSFERQLRQRAFALMAPRIFALPTFRLFSSDIQARGPPA